MTLRPVVWEALTLRLLRGLPKDLIYHYGHEAHERQQLSLSLWILHLTLTYGSNQSYFFSVETISEDAGVPVPSLRLWIESARRFSKRSTTPLGQRTCSKSTYSVRPSPKCTRMSLLEE